MLLASPNHKQWNMNKWSTQFNAQNYITFPIETNSVIYTDFSFQKPSLKFTLHGPPSQIDPHQRIFHHFPRSNVFLAWFRASSYNISKWPWKPSKHAMAAQHSESPLRVFFAAVRHEWYNCNIAANPLKTAFLLADLKIWRKSKQVKHTSGHIRHLRWLSLASAACNWVIDASSMTIGKKGYNGIRWCLCWYLDPLVPVWPLCCKKTERKM